MQQGLTFAYEKKKIREGFSFVVGCDEVGRGCVAGPVVASAVALDLRFRIKDLRGVTDSKLLNAKQRERFDGIIRQNALGWGIGVVSHKVIDKINIHQASLLAMRKAVESLMSVIPSECSRVEESLSQDIKGSLHSSSDAFRLGRDDIQGALVALDGKFTIPSFHMKQESVVDGDAKILSIAAASIIAKVYRDKLMVKLHQKYPSYQFFGHKGYATLRHRTAIKKFGLSPIHRKSFCKNYI
jgi:ribonuclease HII